MAKSVAKACGSQCNSPRSLSNLLTMLSHNMATISEIGEFRIHFAFALFLFGFTRLNHT